MSDTCRSCQAPVIWLEHPITGKCAPIDAEPVPDGNIIVLGDGCYQIITGEERQDAIDQGLVLHLNHFVTCPQSATWKARAATQGTKAGP